MKKLVSAFVLLGSTSIVHADYKLVTSDASELSKLCIAAAEAGSRSEMLAITSAAGITPREVETLRCNGLPLTRFALKYGKRNPSPVVAVAGTPDGYLLRKSDTSPLTELCAAAALSDADYARVKELHFSDDANIDSELLCNGQPLKAFVSKYRSSSTALIGAR